MQFYKLAIEDSQREVDLFPTERLNRETPRSQEVMRCAIGRTPRRSGSKHLQMQSPQKWLSYFSNQENAPETSGADSH